MWIFYIKGVAVNKRLVRQKWWIILAIFLYIHGSFLCYQIIGPVVAGQLDLLLHLCTLYDQCLIHVVFLVPRECM